MAEFTPYGDPFDRVNKLLKTLDADAAALAKESRALGSTVGDVEKARTRLTKQSEGKIGRVGGVTGGTRGTRDTDAATSAERRLNRVRQDNLRVLRQQGLYQGTAGRTAYLQGLRLEEERLARINSLKARGGVVLGPAGQPTTRPGGIILPPGAAARPQPGTAPQGPTIVPTTAAETQRTIRQADQAYARQASSIGKAGAAQRDWSVATRQSLAAQTAATRNLRSYGALTTEFFASAGRGTVTIRELGFQTTATIQKFGGWLGAGAAVYAALGAVSAIGKGAIDASSGVDQLERVVDNVDPSHVTAKFRELSKEFNLPIDQVTDASYQMGKVFHDQDQALESSRSILYAVKVGELDVATASRYLTSIVNGFNLTAEQQSQVFDQVNEAQNRYSVSIDGVLAGTSKAAGAFRNAGGDVTTLIALITALSKASGQTGNIIGTAIQRSPHFIALEQNKERLSSVGINPEQSIDKIYKQAIDAAKGKSGNKQRELAEALFGPQYGARVGIFLLQQGRLFNRVLADVQPDKAKGSAQRELNSVLNQTDERLKAIINSLGILGSNLDSAGVFDVFKLALGSLQGMLDVTNSLLEVFNQLPQPLKQVLVLAAQAGVALKALRFFNAGQSLGGQETGLGRFFTAPQQTTRNYRGLLADQQGILAGKRSSATTAAANAALRAQGYQAELTAAKANQANAERLYGARSKEVAAAAKTVAASQAQLVGAESAHLEAKVQQTIVQKELLLNAEQQALLTRRTTAAQAKAVAGAYGVAIPGAAGSVADDAARQQEQIRKNVAAKAGGGGTILLPSGTEVPSSAVVAKEAETLRKLTVEKRGLTSSLKAVRAQGGKFGLAGGAMVLAGRGAVSKLNSARSSIGRINLKAIPKAFQGLRVGLSSMLGPLDALILAALFVPQIARGLTDRVDRLQSEADALLGQPKSAKDLESKISGLRAKADEISGAPGIGDPLGRLGYVGGKITGAIDESAAAYEATADGLVAARGDLLSSLNAGKETSAPGQLFAGDVRQTVDLYISQLESGRDSLKEFNSNMSNLYKTIRNSLPGRDATRLITEARLAAIDSKGVQTKYQEFAALAGEDLQKTIESYATLLQGGFGRGQDVTALIQRVLPQISEAINSSDPRKRAFAAQGLESLTDGLKGMAQNELDTALAFAKTQSDRNRAYENFFKQTDPRQINRIFGQQRRDLERQLHQAEQAAGVTRGAIRDQDAAYIAGSKRPFYSGKVPGSVSKELRDELRKREEGARGIRQQLRGLDAAQKAALERIRLINKEAADARYEENAALYQAQTQLRVSRLPEGLPAIRYQLSRIKLQIQRAIKRFGRNSVETLQLLETQQGLINDQFQAEIDLINARGEYSGSLINPDTDPVGAARNRLRTAEDVLAATRRNPRSSQADLLQAAAEVNQARLEVSNEVRTQAEAVKDASFELARARAGDNEAAVARIDVREARSKLKSARTPAERIQAQADLINARRDRRDAVAQRQIEDIEFQADIGKLTLDQQINAYRKLLQTVNLTRNMRRDLRRKIHDLRNETDDSFDLNVGDIKIPTIYEIKRAIGGGVTGGPNRTVVSTTNNITVNANGARASEVVEELHRTMDGANSSSLRSAGLI